MDSPPHDFMTVEQAADYLQLSQSSIRSYIRQGRLKAFRVGGLRKVRIDRAELLKLLQPVDAAEPPSTLSPDADRPATTEQQAGDAGA